MNYRGVYKRQDLAECPVCGMDAGKRMMTGREPEQYYVVCEICGFKTRPHPTQSAATNEWSRKSRTWRRK